MRPHRLMIAVTALGSLLLAGCSVSVDSGNSTTTHPEAKPFTAISASNAFDVSVRKGDKPELTVTVPSNVADRVVATVEGNTLTLSLRDAGTINGAVSAQVVTADPLTAVTTQSAAKVSGTADVFGPALTIKAGEASSVTAAANGNEVKVSAQSASHVTVNGQTENADLTAESASSIDGVGLTARTATVAASQASNVSITATETLNAKASSASHVTYHGGAKVTEDKDVSSSISAG